MIRILAFLLAGCSAFAQSVGSTAAFRAASVPRAAASESGGGNYTLRFVAATTAGVDTVVTNTSGCTLFVIALNGYTSDPTVTDDQGNTPTYRISHGSGGGTRVRLAEIANPNTNSIHYFTNAGGDGADYRQMIVMGFSGNEASPFDAVGAGYEGNFGWGFDNGALPGSITPAQANELFVTALAHTTGAITNIDSGFTIQAKATNVIGRVLEAATKLSVSGATNPKWQSDEPNITGIAVQGAWK